jgi:hypothetical protein
VLEQLREVYQNDALAREQGMSPEERLRFHQAESGPRMAALEKWFKEQFAERKVEPNAGLGQAILYMQNIGTSSRCSCGKRGRQSHDVYVSEPVTTIHYRWHALYGVSLQCRRRHGPDCLECELPDGTSALVPTWMVDGVTCSRFSSGAPLVSLEALERLRTLLDSLPPLRNSKKSTPRARSKKEKSAEE